MNQLDVILKEIDEDANKDFDIETYYKLQILLKSHQDSIEVIWRFARACYKYAEVIADTNIKRTIILEGRVLQIYKSFSVTTINNISLL